jgi:hypothetical protein
MTILTEEQTYDLADKIYWQVLNVMGCEKECVENAFRGTINTKLGESLYFAIEQTIQDFETENDDD